MNNLKQDLRYALRQLRKSPGFTLTAILTLALGIGATTAIFSVVDGVLLKPLPYRDSGRLVVVWEKVRFLEKLIPHVGPNPRHVQTWEQRSTVFSDFSLLRQASAGVSVGVDHPRFVGTLTAQPNLLDVLGVQPVLGRNFLPEEAVKGHEDVAIISWRLWQDLFLGDPRVIGRTLQIAGVPHQVVGVLPQNFYFPRANELSPQPEAQETPETEVVAPLVMDFNNLGMNSDYGNYAALGHLKPGITPAHAQAQLNAISNDIARQIPPDQLYGSMQGALSTYVQPLKEVLVGRTTRSLWLLFAAVLSVLLIACVNLANAQLARFVGRDREAALRSALGASAWSLLQSSLAEVCLLSAAGGVLGVLLAVEAVHRFSSFAHVALPRTGNLTVNPAVLALSVVLTVGATVLFGALPALRLLRIRPQEALQGAGRSSGSRRGSLLRRWLIGAQIFACTTLLLVTGLFAKSLAHLLRSDMGYKTAHIVVADVYLQGDQFTDEKRIGFDDGVLDRLRTLPGVQSAALTSMMLLEGEQWINGVNRTDKDYSVLANYRWISPDYFATLQQRILEGRPLNVHDRTAKNAVISEATARAAWPEESALGRQFSRNGDTFTVVGIAADAHDTSLHTAPVNMVYLPYWDLKPRSNYFLVRSTEDTSLLADAVRKTIWSYDPEVTIARVHTLDSQVRDSLAPERLETMLLAGFGGAALLLALLGVYGMLSYSVEVRTQEIGIRMALGASRRNVYATTLKEIVTPVALGLWLGWMASFEIGKSVAALLYGTDANDPGVALAVISAFALAAAAAAFVPCRRATRVDPMVALRME